MKKPMSGPSLNGNKPKQASDGLTKQKKIKKSGCGCKKKRRRS
ncbi:hypothetical protein [Metabacillus arenae]|nr:hypothetical protein [Metabacillus arenae]